jgi:integrase
MARKIKGVRRHGAGWQTYCRVDGEYRSETWPLETPVSEMTAWLKQQRGEQRDEPRAHAKHFETDAKTYLEKVRALPTYAQRTTHIALWVACFRGRRRKSITGADVRGQRDRWLLEGLAPHTVNLRLRALSNLWTVLDGRRAKNPVRDVPEAAEPAPEPRALPYWLAERIVDRIDGPLEYAQALVMITTGLSPVEIGGLHQRHWQGRLLFVQGRRKGHGGLSRSIPLTDAAMAALKAFAAVSAVRGWQRLPSKQFYRQFRKACRRVAEDPLAIDDSLRERVRALAPYDLRHTYATKLYLESGDAHAAARILGHRSTSTTARYVAAALTERMARAVAALEEAVQHDGQKVANEPRQNPQRLAK